MPAMKIMRRGGDGDTGPSASKATSETGSDGKDKSLSAKEKFV
jgi:SUZ domain